MSPGQLTLVAVGAALVAVAAIDLFLTVFNYDGFTFVAARYQRLLWKTATGSTAWMPSRPRNAARSLGSAMLLPATVAWWVAAEITGFALIFTAGLETGGFRLSQGVHPGIGVGYYLSAGAESSLTFGDVIPLQGVYRGLVDFQTILGLATFTLALGYVVTTFGVLGDLDGLHNTVRRHARDPRQPTSILARHYRGGEASELPNLLQVLSERLESYDEGLRRYPVVFFFHTRRSQRSIPRVFLTLGELLAAIQWGLPREDPIVADPWLAALMGQYSTTMGRLQRSFVGPERWQAPEPATPEAFEDEYRSGGGDHGVGRFRRLQERTRSAVGRGDTSPADEYDRYLEWLDFDARTQAILDRVRESLGYGPEEIDPHAPVS